MTWTRRLGKLKLKKEEAPKDTTDSNQLSEPFPYKNLFELKLALVNIV